MKSKCSVKMSILNLTNIGGHGTFGRAFVPQRLKKESLYHEILLL